MTNEEKQEIIDAVINYITAQSTSINEVEVITDGDLTGVNTLPCTKNDGTVIQVAVDILAAPARAAATSANNAATSATSAASAASSATNAVNNAFNEIQSNINNVIIPGCEQATAAANVAAANIGNKKILVITEDQYTALLNDQTIEVEGVQYHMDSNTIYFCTEVETPAPPTPPSQEEESE